MTHLEVDGEPVMDLTAYDFRWYGKPGEEQCSLYFHGRRVIKAWKLTMDVDNPQDPYGENANTA